jgi:hypothetical protein
MSSERIDPEFREAVVTYSVVPQRELDFAEERAPAARREPTLDATEIHVLDGHASGRSFDIRADRRDDDGEVPPVSAAAIDLDGKRSPLSRIVFATAALSIVAGVGVLAATVGIATFTPSRTTAQVPASAPPALAAVEPKADAAAPSTSGVREIPLATNGEAATTATATVAPKDVAPPVPRARPEDTGSSTVARSTEPVPAGAELRPSAGPEQPEVAVLPPPGKSVPTVPELVPVLPPPVATLPPPAAPVVAVSVPASGGNTDDLISSIEQTLAKRDATGMPLQTGIDPHGIAAGPAGEGPVTVLPPPASMAPNYPAAQGGYPAASAQGPTYDVVPPAPVTGNGYGVTYPVDAYPPAYPAGPVPPANVPYAYPGEAMDYEMIPEKRPGFLRRTWMRTADTVKGVFGRDDGEDGGAY